MATISIIGDLVNDQSAGQQDDDIAFASIDSAFSAYLGTLGLDANQLAFASSVYAAEQQGLVTVNAAAGEVVDSLIFAPLSGAPSGLTAVDGGAITLTTTQGGQAVVASDSTGDTVAVFWMIPGADNLTGTVQMVTFEPISHPDSSNPDDRVDFSDILKVRAISHVDESVGGDINADDDGPSISLTGNEPTLTTDDTNITDSDSGNFAPAFSSDPGTDGLGATGGISYDLGTPGGASGLIATVLDEAINLVEAANGDIEGRTALTDALAFSVHVDVAGNVTLTQLLAVRHDPDTGPDQSTTLAPDLVTLTATITDADGDSAAATANIGDNLVIRDDAPSIEPVGTPGTILVDETNLGVSASADFSGNFSHLTGNDGLGALGGISYALSVGPVSGLLDTDTGEAIGLNVVGGTIEARDTDGDLEFTIGVDGTGLVTLTQFRSVEHPDITNPDDLVSMLTDGLVTLTATITDGDGDQASADLDITHAFIFQDDAPEITVPSSAPDAASAIHLGNAVGQTATGDIGWDVGNDGIDYAAGGSDFAAVPTLTGTVINDGPITNAVVTAGVEDAHTAVFDFSFHFDSDPITPGIQDATGGGTLTFNKDTDQFTLAVTDEAEGFSFSVLHTNELLAKAPPGNTGHPEIVAEQLTPDGDPNPFFIQFTGNSLTQNGVNSSFGFNDTGDGATPADKHFDAGQLITNGNEDWVSATQATNGVAGDTIQKGELLTLRFFEENILGDVNPGAPGGGNERLTPTATADGVAIKFDGIGNAEDLVVILDLISADGLTHTTRAINVQNADLIKGAVPAPYNSEFSLDNNDALLVMEHNDYNAAGENFLIQGVQIMQSGNGLTGNAINLNGAVGDAGGSSTTAGLTAIDPTDNDVLKITDIGFIQTTQGTQDVSLDFSFAINDGDGDTTTVQHINALMSSDFVV